MATENKIGAGLPSPFQTVLPKGLGIGRDKLLLRLDFYGEAIVMQDIQRKGGAFRLISALDLAKALAGELSFASGLLPGDPDTSNTLWWSNTRSGAVTAIWLPPGVRRLALQVAINQPPERYDVPLPGLIFLCRPSRQPWVYAATRRPGGPKDRVYKAPLANVYSSGDTCSGSNRYPADVGSIPESFLCSFFSEAADVRGRSKKDPESSVIKMWKALDKKDKYPIDDLVYHGTVADLMVMRI